MKKIAIYAKKVSKADLPVFETLLSGITQQGWQPLLETELALQLQNKFQWPATFDVFESHQDLKSNVELMISVGGDGTFLKAVSYVRDSKVPILGINTGRLGFLSNLSKDKIGQTLERFAAGHYEFQKRSLLRVHTENALFGDENFALNELTLLKKDTSSMIKVHAYLGEKFLNTYWADGLIVGTPTGSTAYSLSCGGPIITPGCQVHILTPIAPHNLNVRPVVVPDHMPISLEVEGRERSYLLSLDGHSQHIKQGEKVTITKAEFMINVVKFEDNNFLDTIRNKMLWGSDTRNEL
ncbi:MAG: NAD kinase [Sphingomonadales bacterium]|nr:NAD kinase [Sphingomonadales bacterium]